MIQLRKTNLLKLCCYIVLAILVFEVLFVNVILLWMFFKIKNELDLLSNLSLDTFIQHYKLENVIYSGKNGGFDKLMKEIIGRFHMVSYPSERGFSRNYTTSQPDISFFGFDVSQNREASILYRRINSRRTFPFHRLIVDIGANDGLISSNSYNFIQWGWNAILVEPQRTALDMAVENTLRYVDPYHDGHQNISYVNAVISQKNGLVNFVVKPADVYTTSHLQMSGDVLDEKDIIVQVESYTVANFAQKYKIPQNFGILSIDAEGMSYEILKQWINLDFRPAYIIVEKLHEKPLGYLLKVMESTGYHLMCKLGWNVIFEYRKQKV